MSEPWPTFTAIERRLLGVLVEKSKTTPDGYPLSINALTVGANQKSNRDPVMNLTDDDVEEALPNLMSKGLVTRITGSRVDRYRHNLYEVWHVDKVELAILAELLLRGPQTEGELRGHAHRMDPIADLDALRQKLKPLQERNLVVWIGDEGRRGSLIAHGFHSPAELENLRRRLPAADASPPSAPASPPPPSELSQLRTELADLRREVAELRAEVTALKNVPTS